MSLLADVPVAMRSLRRRPGYVALAVGILALGIGANAAMFSLVDAVLLRPLPYADADTLVVLYGDGVARGQTARQGVSAGEFLDWRDQSGSVFTGLAALRNESRRITSLEQPVVPLVHGVTANYFDVMGARTVVGRSFANGEDAPGREPVAILSYATWQGVFGGDPAIVGRTIDLDDQAHVVVGVMNPDFHTSHGVARQPGLWVTTPIESLRDQRTLRDLFVYGRLAPGVDIGEARAAMVAVGARLAREYPATNDRWSVAIAPVREHVVGAFSRTALILLAAVLLVLLIACANVANLTLARAAERSQEVAVRTVLGASRTSLMVQMMTESLLLALAGGALGTLGAWLGVGVLAQVFPTQAGVPMLDRVVVDGRVVLFALVSSVVAGGIFGLLPARQATRVDLVPALREHSRGNLVSPERRLREVLVVAEVALAVVVASGAGLMLRTFAGLERVSPGFDAERVLKLRTGVRGEDYATPAARQAHYAELKRRLEAVPGVAIASGVSFEPPAIPAGDGGVFGTVRLLLPGHDDGGAAPSAVSRGVLPDYFATMGIPVIRGRALGLEDEQQGRGVAVISATMAARYFPGVDPLGRTFSVHGPDARTLEIVGIVGDVVTSGADPSPHPAFYTPYALNPLSVMSLVMRVPQGDALVPAPEAERVTWSSAPSINVYGIETLDRRIADLNWRTRFGALLLAGFAALALVLGAAGIYAVVSYTVGQRRAEIGLRIALGARGSDVVAMVLGGGLRLVGVGIAVGTLASLGATRVLQGQLYGVAPGDPGTLVAVGAVLTAVAVVACVLPALRASRVDPQVVLRG